ncbi:MAG: hypothetical protein JJ953_07415 [Gracilimonas sp.]|uniref:Uncharacterized protein n=1 Tax=Gracilimonas sediminicola TaxID=2952158 RepID=A0A9X2L4D1_9BACT|nr:MULTISPECIES: hypothetical protein [Gracilimonas]MBO6585912.1 hypothetical protein [Gracilimonas sp.]MBO6616909.1 hypothetical protein [Gracilimonas sp.]MCP9292161.1 hypothetical protein [Gracilimonas sediminicola]
MVAISVGLALGLIVLGVVTMAGAGVRSLVMGKQDYKKIGMMAIPFVVFGIAYAISGEFSDAGVMTAALMMLGMVAAIVLTGLRGTFKF